MRDVFVCDAVRTPIGRFGGSLAKVRADCPLDKAVVAAQEAGKKYITIASRVLAGK